MGTRWAMPVLAVAVGLAAAGCGGSNSAAPSASATRQALTPYQRAYPVICQSATTAPPTDAPGVSTQPLWYRLAWARGFCQGDEAVRIWNSQPLPVRGRDAVAAGNAARLALVTSPPDCLIVRGTPAEPFCP